MTPLPLGYAKQPETPTPHAHISCYEVSCWEQGSRLYYDNLIRVEKAPTKKNPELWAVRTDGVSCLNAQGIWGYEPSPSDRSDAWLSDHRFDLVRALQLAQEQAKIFFEDFHGEGDHLLYK